jgi:predicted transport protein
MSDIKLYRMAQGGVSELAGGAVALEKSLQNLFEANLETLLGVRFLASEFATNEGGRMDSLGIDENNSPVVIEYKRSSNENVINQGLYYLDWLMGHRKDFEWLVLEKLGPEAAKQVDWSGPRLICVAGDFGKYDEHAVKQMNRNIALIRYRKFEGDLLLLEQLTSASAKATTSSPAPVSNGASGGKPNYKTIEAQMAEAPQPLLDLYHLLSDYMLALGDDVEAKTTAYYIAFRRIKNFASLEVRNQAKKLLVFVKVNPDMVTLEPGFTRDVRGIGHFGTGDLEITIQSASDFEKAKPLLDQSYSAS